MFVDLVEGAAEPPEHSPAEQYQRSRIFDVDQLRAVALQIPGGKQPGDADQHTAEINAVQDRRQRARSSGVESERNPRGKLQENTEAARAELFLAHADPDNGRALQRPGGGGPAP